MIPYGSLDHFSHVTWWRWLAEDFGLCLGNIQAYIDLDSNDKYIQLVTVPIWCDVWWSCLIVRCRIHKNVAVQHARLTSCYTTLSHLPWFSWSCVMDFSRPMFSFVRHMPPSPPVVFCDSTVHCFVSEKTCDYIFSSCFRDIGLYKRVTSLTFRRVTSSVM